MTALQNSIKFFVVGHGLTHDLADVIRFKCQKDDQILKKLALNSLTRIRGEGLYVWQRRTKTVCALLSKDNLN